MTSKLISLLSLIPFSLYVPRKNSFKQRTNFELDKKKKRFARYTCRGP